MNWLLLRLLIYFFNSRISVRIAGGTWPGRGRVEVWHRNAWHLLCGDGWDEEDANVVCTQLGWQGGKVLPCCDVESVFSSAFR